jgi:hypothetical protein
MSCILFQIYTAGVADPIKSGSGYLAINVFTAFFDILLEMYVINSLCKLYEDSRSKNRVRNRIRIQKKVVRNAPFHDHVVFWSNWARNLHGSFNLPIFWPVLLLIKPILNKKNPCITLWTVSFPWFLKFHSIFSIKPLFTITSVMWCYIVFVF